MTSSLAQKQPTRRMTKHGARIEHFETECDTRDDARDWADLQAGARGFTRVIEETDGPEEE